MIDPFEFVANPARVVFGSGTIAQVPAELARLDARRVLVLTTPQQQVQGQAILDMLGQVGAGIFSDATMHTPVDVTERALKIVKELRADCVVAIGGGSTTGLGKAIALRTDLPQLVIPTTYAGSEMTTILGETNAGRKTTIRDLKVLPETVIYDVDLTLGLPPVMSGTSGINAIAHAVEALYADNGNPVLAQLAEQGIRHLARSLPTIARTPTDIEARTDALYGAWLCAICLGTAGVALHHKICHTLGGSFDLPHAETHTIVLPHAVGYNAPAIPDAMAALRRALDSDSPADALFDLAADIAAPLGLAEIGMATADVTRAVDILLENRFFNPRSLDRARLEVLLADAVAGRRPRTDSLS